MKAISKVVAVLAVGALALGMFGCSSGSNASADSETTYTSEDINAQEITINKSGYSVVPSTTIDAEGNQVPISEINFAFTVNNPNTGYVAQNIPFNVNGYNTNGEVVFSGGATCMYLYPGIETAISGTTSLSAVEGMDQNVTEFTVEPLTSNIEWLKTGLSDADIQNMFTVENETLENADGGLSLSATVTGDLADQNKIFKVADLEDTLEAHAIVILYDANGNIVYGSESTNILIDQTTLDNAKDENGNPLISNLSISMPNAPEYSDYQLFVMPSL